MGGALNGGGGWKFSGDEKAGGTFRGAKRDYRCRQKRHERLWKAVRKTARELNTGELNLRKAI